MNDMHVTSIIFTDEQERMLRKLSKDIGRCKFALGMILGVIVVELLEAKARLQALEDRSNRKNEMAG